MQFMEELQKDNFPVALIGLLLVLAIVIIWGTKMLSIQKKARAKEKGDLQRHLEIVKSRSREKRKKEALSDHEKIERVTNVLSAPYRRVKTDDGYQTIRAIPLPSESLKDQLKERSSKLIKTRSQNQGTSLMDAPKSGMTSAGSKDKHEAMEVAQGNYNRLKNQDKNIPKR